MPAKITHIRSMIAKESDPSSPLWAGHVKEGDFVHPRMIQPDSLARLLAHTSLDQADMKDGEEIILPSKVTRADLGAERDGANGDDESLPEVEGLGIGSGKVEQGVRIGPHWFEVVPRNKVQSELVILTTK